MKKENSGERSSEVTKVNLFYDEGSPEKERQKWTLEDFEKYTRNRQANVIVTNLVEPAAYIPWLG